MSDKDKLREAMDAIIAGKEPPEGVLFHASHSTTKADWDALDPNSYETTCAKCGSAVIGQFGPNGETTTPCASCGATDYEGGIGSPAGAFSLAMHDPAFD